MKLGFGFLLLLLHYIVASISCYYLGEFLSDTTNVAFGFLIGLGISIVIITIIEHTLSFVLRIRNYKQG